MTQSRPGKRDGLMARVARFSAPDVDVKTLIAATSEFQTAQLAICKDAENATQQF
jgi:hypothetical protein